MSFKSKKAQMKQDENKEIAYYESCPGVIPIQINEKGVNVKFSVNRCSSIKINGEPFYEISISPYHPNVFCEHIGKNISTESSSEITACIPEYLLCKYFGKTDCEHKPVILSSKITGYTFPENQYKFNVTMIQITPDILRPYIPDDNNLFNRYKQQLEKQLINVLQEKCL